MRSRWRSRVSTFGEVQCHDPFGDRDWQRLATIATLCCELNMRLLVVINELTLCYILLRFCDGSGEETGMASLAWMLSTECSAASCGVYYRAFNLAFDD